MVAVSEPVKGLRLLPTAETVPTKSVVAAPPVELELAVPADAVALVPVALEEDEPLVEPLPPVPVLVDAVALVPVALEVVVAPEELAAVVELAPEEEEDVLAGPGCRAGS